MWVFCGQGNTVSEIRQESALEQNQAASNKSDDHTDADYKFYEYYAEQSLSPESIQRFESIQNIVTRTLTERSLGSRTLDVADIGCNAGTQCIMWARDGHNVHGVDINDLLLDQASVRANEAGLDIEYVLGSAEDLPWQDDSMDVCLAPELLEHVVDWRRCLDEFSRILKPNGVMYLSTTNYLCPKQQEFELPLYSWYPSVLKEYYERLAMSSRPELVNYAKYPAVNWFSFYSLRAELSIRGFDSFDRFDVVDTAEKGFVGTTILRAIRIIPPIRWLGHVATPYTSIVAVKRAPLLA